MSDFKSKLPDLKELSSMSSKLFHGIKSSVTEIIHDYKEKRAEQEKAEAAKATETTVTATTETIVTSVKTPVEPVKPVDPTPPVVEEIKVDENKPS
jgi:hypothetical protein